MSNVTDTLTEAVEYFGELLDELEFFAQLPLTDPETIEMHSTLRIAHTNHRQMVKDTLTKYELTGELDEQGQYAYLIAESTLMSR